MIIQTAPAGQPHLAIMMYEHTALAHQFARAFGNSRFEAPAPLDLVAYIVLHHDAGWAEFDRDPLLALATELSVAENIFLGRERRREGLLRSLRILDRSRMAKEAAEALESLAIEIHSVRARCGLLSGGQRQAVAVARAVLWGSNVLLLDEPTAALAVMESEKIGQLVNEVAKRQVGVVLVSHNMPQVHELCDRIVVLLRGRVVANLRKEEITVQDIVMWITGAALSKN